MKQSEFTILSNTRLTRDVWELALSGDTSAITNCGQFVNLRLAGNFLRRPLSVCDWDEEHLTVCYKTVGRGTEQLCCMKPGETLDVLTGLGNGFDTAKSGDTPLLIGGGVGLTPLYALAKELLEQGKQVKVLLGFNTKSEVFYEDRFRTLGASVTVTTADGSYGTKGFVTDALPADCSYFYTCGPEAMFRALHRAVKTSGQFSFEARMGCGFGACMGCSCKTITGYKRICKDGPVLEKEEILWED